MRKLSPRAGPVKSPPPVASNGSGATALTGTGLAAVLSTTTLVVGGAAWTCDDAAPNRRHASNGAKTAGCILIDPPRIGLRVDEHYSDFERPETSWPLREPRRPRARPPAGRRRDGD